MTETEFARCQTMQVYANRAAMLLKDFPDDNGKNALVSVMRLSCAMVIYVTVGEGRYKSIWRSRVKRYFNVANKQIKDLCKKYPGLMTDELYESIVNATEVIAEFA